MEGALVVYCWLPLNTAPPISADSPSESQTVYAFVNDSLIYEASTSMVSHSSQTQTQSLFHPKALAAAVEL